MTADCSPGPGPAADSIFAVASLPGRSVCSGWNGPAALGLPHYPLVPVRPRDCAAPDCLTPEGICTENRNCLN